MPLPLKQRSSAGILPCGVSPLVDGLLCGAKAAPTGASRRKNAGNGADLLVVVLVVMIVVVEVMTLRCLWG